jgi:hypothetical protein
MLGAHQTRRITYIIIMGDDHPYIAALMLATSPLSEPFSSGIARARCRRQIRMLYSPPLSPLPPPPWGSSDEVSPFLRRLRHVPPSACSSNT